MNQPYLSLQHDLEQAIAQLEGMSHCIAYGSGLALWWSLSQLWPTGSRVLLDQDCLSVSAHLPPNVGFDAVDFERIDLSDPQYSGYVALWTATLSPTLLEWATHQRMRVILDNTFNPGRGPSNVDLVVHRHARCLSGTSQAPIAFAATNAQPLAERLKATSVAPGFLESTLLLHGLTTLSLRLQRTTETTEWILVALQAHPAIQEVRRVAPNLLDLYVDRPNLFGGLSEFKARPLGLLDSAYTLYPSRVRLSIGIEDPKRLLRDLLTALHLCGPGMQIQTPKTLPVHIEDIPSVPQKTPEPVLLAPESPELTSLDADSPQHFEPALQDPAAGLGPEALERYNALRDWRNEEAKQQKISRFLVASNSILAEIASQNPKNLDELLSVKGMGKERISKYGIHILELLKKGSSSR
ncbi:MAG: HRDC domain-containing protein [Deinococcaceae bacterium]